MTVYVALDAVRSGKLTLDTPLVMSVRAARMPPSKMGFRPGTEVTLDNALKMLMVKSPNDVAVMVAEGVSGSVEAFANDMNAAGQRLGLQELHFVNPNGLHDPAHVSSARDMAMIARALLREFPDHADLFSIGALQLGNQYIANHNGLLGRYPGADGMKTGFTCPAGFNVVASANHSGRRLIVVVLGAPTARSRNQEAADLFDRGFAMGGGNGSLESLPSSGSGAPNMRADVCLRRNAAAIAAAEDGGFRRRPEPGGRGQRAAGPRSPTRSRRCSRPWRTPCSRTKGSDLIRFPSFSVPPRAGRGRRWAPARRERRQRPITLKALTPTPRRRRPMARGRSPGGSSSATPPWRPRARKSWRRKSSSRRPTLARAISKNLSMY